MPERLDHALASRGLSRSRTAAARSVDAGQVLVNGKPALKPSQKVDPADMLEVCSGLGYVSRAAHKLLAALDDFSLSVQGQRALDVGASTGGFTQVLLERGAADVVALDVGHDQLDGMLRADTRVTVIEGENARYLTEDRLNACISAQRAEREPLRAHDLTVAVGDLSFISLRYVLPALRDSLPQLQWAVMLVKPQFEVGRRFVRGGLVHDVEVAADAVVDVVNDAATLGLRTRGFCESPVTGTHGNREFLLWLSADAPASLNGEELGDQRKIARIREIVVKGAS